jgi:hypothetical protein
MACDFSALSNIDPNDPEQAAALLQQCTATLTDPMLWVWAAVFTIVGALVGAWIGKRRNAVKRDVLLGATLGPIGWVISLLLPKEKAPLQCASCKGIVAAKDAHCRHCGVSLRT